MVRRAPHRAGRAGDPRRPRRGPEQGGHPGDAGPRGRGLRPALLRSSREPAASSRRLLRRRLQGPRPDARHPVRERLRAPPAAHDRARERRLPSFRQGSRLLGDGAPRRGLRGQAPDPGAAHRAGGGRAARGPRLPRLARRGRGPAHVHGGHGGLEPRHDRRHLRRPRPPPRGPRPPGRGDGRDKLEPLIGWEGNALTTGNPPSDGARVDAALVRRLIAARFPQWADLPVRPVEVGGGDNRTFHLGPRLTVRLPRGAHHAPPGRHNFFRGGPLTVYDAETQQAVDALDGRIDTEAALAAWEAALGAEWGGPPVWLHGDVAAGNLLGEEGRLGAVIDFGCLGVGDPACDLAIAWMGAGSWLDAVEGPDHARRTHRHRPVAGGRGTTRDRRGVGRSQARRVTRISASEGHPTTELIATVRLARRNVD